MARLGAKGDRLVIEGEVTFGEAPRLLEEFDRALADRTGGTLGVDLTGVRRIDSAGAALLDEMEARSRAKGIPLSFTGTPSEVERIRHILAAAPSTPISPPAPEGIFERWGGWGYGTGRTARAFVQLAADTFYWGFLGFVNRRGGRKGAFVTQSLLIGVDALPVLVTISFLVGAILALQSAAQLRQFGANIFVADLIAVSMTREMGPLMTAIILAGRSGSSIASEIATMTVTEEIDALKTMGVNPVRYVVVPKFHAITVCTPFLSLIATLVGICGGLVIALFYLDILPDAYLREVLDVLRVKDVVTGLVKSLVFAGLICVVGAHFGFRVKGGAEGVGRATTGAVVASIFAVVVADCFFSLVFYF